MQNPPWTRDELILALDLYIKHRGSPPGKNSAAVLQLSNQLNEMGRNVECRDEDYRNTSGVYMKMMNFRSLDPLYTSTGKKGLTGIGSGDKKVWDEYNGNVMELREAANVIIKNIGVDRSIGQKNLQKYIAEAREGKVLTKIHVQRERSKSLIESKKKYVMNTCGVLECEVCGFSFHKFYGERGKNFAEVHHIKPLSYLDAEASTKIEDLAIVCSNCHRMIHSQLPWLAIQELKDLIAST
ncbi:HNH endonuclease [Solidesulfovibrio magneticus]|nr:HNH endonuclease [Solidesulfovibrio magneticus]